MKAMEIPVMENGERVGTLRVSAKGLYTLFEARLPPAAALSRLWLLGKNGSAAHLGLLAPCPSGRVFSRRLTRLECSRLPAAPQGPVRRLAVPPYGGRNAPVFRGHRAACSADGQGLRAPFAGAPFPRPRLFCPSRARRAETGNGSGKGGHEGRTGRRPLFCGGKTRRRQ